MSKGTPTAPDRLVGWVGVGCLTVVGSVVLPLAWFYDYYTGVHYDEVWSVDCGNGRNISVSVCTFDDGAYTVYSVRDGHRLVVSNNLVHLSVSGIDASRVSLQTACSRDGSIWAVFEAANPRAPIILHDFASNESYTPDLIPTPVSERPVAEAAWKEVLRRLERDSP